ncbi:Eukaryotic translation initiation factor 3 subunit I (eIF3i) (Eukaryotic translation initiation factor 3 subunit 2) (eIF-3-beta) (eIF3 p36) [Durusdinium trenchii]|uniref:Serine-threonine kinase receptor-associated protein n=1 Tax=Durusdinium trenchii TaxID=1381693 RepID=A0ABP0I346_9DINO
MPTVWFSSNGERLGTYDGHKGTVWWLDPTKDSKILLTGGADMTLKIWNVETGEKLHDFPHTGPVRHVEWAEGDGMFVSVSDPFRGAAATVSVYEFSRNVDEQPQEPKYVWEVNGLEQGKKISRATWLPLNKAILTCDEFGVMRIHEVETGRVIREIHEHSKRINCLSWNKEKFFLITGSADNSAILWDAVDWKVLKVYETDRPVNAVAISPIKEHVFVAGGQEAMSVTTTSAKVGKFETKLFHMVFGEEFGNVRGHFGPVNTIAVHPEGTGYVCCEHGGLAVAVEARFTSGSEDGYVRVHDFDKEYFQLHSELDDLSALTNLA